VSKVTSPLNCNAFRCPQLFSPAASCSRL
jgi:hypothetical protein